MNEFGADVHLSKLCCHILRELIVSPSSPVCGASGATIGGVGSGSASDLAVGPPPGHQLLVPKTSMPANPAKPDAVPDDDDNLSAASAAASAACSASACSPIAANAAQLPSGTSAVDCFASEIDKARSAASVGFIGAGCDASEIRQLSPRLVNPSTCIRAV